MESDDKEEFLKKWASIIDSSNTTNVDYPSLLPIAMRVAAKTISSDLHFATEEEINEVKNKVKTENRDGKLDSVLDDKEFIEKKLEEDKEYQELMKKGVTPMNAPKGHLFYLDYKYGRNDDLGDA